MFFINIHFFETFFFLICEKLHDKIKPTVSSLLKTKSSQTQLMSNETICVFAAIKLSSKLRDKVKLINHQRNLH